MSTKIYAISTVSDAVGGRAGWNIYGTGATEDEAMEDAIGNIGGRDTAKSMRESTLYRNLKFVTKKQLSRHGLSD